MYTVKNRNHSELSKLIQTGMNDMNFVHSWVPNPVHPRLQSWEAEAGMCERFRARYGVLWAWLGSHPACAENVRIVLLDLQIA